MTERSDVKAEETRRACALLGVDDVTFFGADDAVLLVTEEVVRTVFGLDNRVVQDPVSHTPLVVPVGRHRPRRPVAPDPQADQAAATSQENR